MAEPADQQRWMTHLSLSLTEWKWSDRLHDTGAPIFSGDVTLNHLLHGSKQEELCMEVKVDTIATVFYKGILNTKKHFKLLTLKTRRVLKASEHWADGLVSYEAFLLILVAKIHPTRKLQIPFLTIILTHFHGDAAWRGDIPEFLSEDSYRKLRAWSTSSYHSSKWLIH